MGNNCVKCKNRPINIKKYELCSACYQRLRAAGKLPVHPSEYRYVANVMNPAEAAFASQHLHPGWVFHPCTLRLLDGTRYTPDFWDPLRKSFIELSSTRQAYYQNRHEYDAVKNAYPTIPFLCVDPSNQEIPHAGFTGGLNEKNAEVQNNP